MTNQTTIRTLRTDSLRVDHDVQRGLSPSRVDKMAEEFNPDALGILTVSHRKDGTYHIVDGQHRWETCKKMGVEHIECEVFTGLTKQDEAALFRVRNNTRIVNALDRFRVAVVEGQTAAKDINDIATKAGWRIPVRPSQNTPGVINSPVALDWVYNGAGIKQRRQPTVFRQTVEIITAAWGYEPDGMRSDVFKGIGAFLTRFEGILDLSKVVRMLQTYPGGPLKLQADAKIMRSMRSSSAADSVASILVGRYNVKRSVNRLPEWFTSSRAESVPDGSDVDTED